MYRRRRVKRDIPFSFDSFLDVVANVCGIIIRLILVAWAGARAYHMIDGQPTIDAAPETEITASTPAWVEPPSIADPLQTELERHRQELARQQLRLLDQLRQFQFLETTNAETAQQLASLATSQSATEQVRTHATTASADHAGHAQTMQLSLADLEKRTKTLATQLRELEALPPLTKTLRYRTPVSRPVQAEELHFECQNGRISFIDLDAFLIETRRGLEDKTKMLKTQWEVEGTTGTVGAFRLHYVLVRERGLLESGGVPNPEAGFRYGMEGWIVEPVTPTRGETATMSLAPGSNFRHVVDTLDAEHAVVTMWIYPDSFALYRELRDFLHERNIEVAGRPLPTGMPIASSRRGTASRGQ